MNTQSNYQFADKSESFTMFKESLKTPIPKNTLRTAVKAVRKKLWKMQNISVCGQDTENVLKTFYGSF